MCDLQASLAAADEGAGKKKRRKRSNEGDMGVAVCQQALRIPLVALKQEPRNNDASSMETDGEVRPESVIWRRKL